MNERPIDHHQVNINMAMWFYRALDTAMAVNDVRLRQQVIEEVVYAHRMCRPPLHTSNEDLSFVNDRTDQITRRK